MKRQSGFTLVEVLVALAITAFIGTGLVAAIAQMINVNELSTNRMTAIKQLENALHIITRDAQMAQTVAIGETSFFDLSWHERDEALQDYSTLHEVTYTITPEGLLQRVDSITPQGQGTQSITSTIAQDVLSDPAVTNCSFAPGVGPSAGTFTIQITATSGAYKSATETRTAHIVLRSSP